MTQSRKTFINQLGMGLLFASTGPVSQTLALHENSISSELVGAADDEQYWRHFAKKYYSVSRDYINLENGYFGVQAKPVLEAFQKNTELVNRQLARFARKEYPALARSIKKTLADFLEVSDEEIIITRNATEALNLAIQGYPFQAGDEVIINQLDYFSMIETFRMLEKRGKITVKAFDMPLQPANEEEIVDAYREQITSKTKVILLTHVSNINGLIVPVSKIAEIARNKSIDIICDSAHALGHIPFQLKSLGADYVGMNLHKWMGNPVGAGVLYVRKEKIPALQPMFGDMTSPETSISKLAHFGTTPFAVTMTIPESINFHKTIGVERINARLRYLTSIWMKEFANDEKVELVTPTNDSLYSAIASFRIRGNKSSDITDFLFKSHNILTVARTLLPEDCIRVTPHLYTSAEDVKKFIQVLKSI